MWEEKKTSNPNQIHEFLGRGFHELWSQITYKYFFQDHTMQDLGSNTKDKYSRENHKKIIKTQELARTHHEWLTEQDCYKIRG